MGMDPNASQTTAPQTTTTAPAEAAAAPVVAPAADAVSADIAALRATIAKQDSAIKALTDEAARRRTETKAERDARAEEARKTGDLKEALRIADEQKAEALAAAKALADEKAALEPDAIAQRAWREQASKKVAEKAASLPANLKPIFDALPTVEAKKAFLVEVLPMVAAPQTTTPTTPAPAPAPAAGSPAPATQSAAGIDLNNASEQQLRELEKSNPAEFNKLFQRPPPSIVDVGRRFLGL
jgi:hypothetical protein